MHKLTACIKGKVAIGTNMQYVHCYSEMHDIIYIPHYRGNRQVIGGVYIYLQYTQDYLMASQIYSGFTDIYAHKVNWLPDCHGQ